MAAGLIYILKIRVHQSHFGMSIQQIRLLLQFIGVNPVIISCTISYVISLTTAQCSKIILSHSEIYLITRIANAIRILNGICPTDLRRSVCRAIIGKLYFKREICLLFKDRIKRTANGILLIVSYYNHRHLRPF